MTAVQVRQVAQEAAPVALFAGLTAVASQVSVPLWPVPMTLQTISVLASGLALGARRGAASQATYLLMGAMGLPVFAEMKAGPFFAFPTGGYLLAFVLVAAIAGWAAERFGKTWKLALALVAANLILLGLGTAYLSVWFGKNMAMAGFVPFIPGAIVQSFAAWTIGRAFRTGNAA